MLPFSSAGRVRTPPLSRTGAARLDLSWCGANSSAAELRRAGACVVYMRAHDRYMPFLLPTENDPTTRRPVAAEYLIEYHHTIPFGIARTSANV